jgi:hypothetical protein
MKAFSAPHAAIRRNDAKASLGERSYLPAPRVPKFREPVQEDDQRPAPHRHVVKASSCLDFGVCVAEQRVVDAGNLGHGPLAALAALLAEPRLRCALLDHRLELVGLVRLEERLLEGDEAP